MSLEYCEAIEAVNALNISRLPLTDDDIKNALINAFNRIHALEVENKKNIKALAESDRE